MRFDPSVRGNIVRKKTKKAAPYNTQLDTGKNMMAASCKCFGRTTQGSCAGHYADLWLREAAAEQALQVACGAVLDLGTRLKTAEGLLDAAFKRLTEAAAQKPFNPRDATDHLQMLRRVKLALADVRLDHMVPEQAEAELMPEASTDDAEPTEEQE